MTIKEKKVELIALYANSICRKAHYHLTAQDFIASAAKFACGSILVLV